MSIILTQKQQRVLETIRIYISENDEAPTLAELAERLNIKTKRGVVKHLDALQKKGFINRTSKTRGIYLVDSNSDTTMSVPILGYANAGQPLVFADEDIVGSIKIDKNFVKSREGLFALIVKGDSMNMRSIKKVPLADKNYVVVQQGADFSDGDVVLAIIDNAATIKTFKKSSNSIILYPESNNPVHTPIYLREDMQGFINGKVIAVLENPGAVSA